jgi:hypothetical protein
VTKATCHLSGCHTPPRKPLSCSSRQGRWVVVFEILFIVGFPDNGTWQQACTLTHNPESNQCDSGQVRLLKPTIINKFPHLLKSLTPHLLYAVTSYFYDYK